MPLVDAWPLSSAAGNFRRCSHGRIYVLWGYSGCTEHKGEDRTKMLHRNNCVLAMHIDTWTDSEHTKEQDLWPFAGRGSRHRSLAWTAALDAPASPHAVSEWVGRGYGHTGEK